MPSNLDRFRTDLAKLIQAGIKLYDAMRLSCSINFKEKLEIRFKDKTEEYIKSLPSFEQDYQQWYSESLVLLKQILPDRVADFVRHYEKPKSRSTITYENYRVDDYLQGLVLTRMVIDRTETIVGKDAAIPHFHQQLAIVQAAQARFESSLFDIRQIIQADLLDSEIAAAEHLAKSKFYRAAGAVAGVVLERHLGQVCVDHKIPLQKKNPTINDFNEALKAASVIDNPQWRFIQHLADIRNICDHAKTPDPTEDQVLDLLAGVKKIIKTVY